MELSEGPKTIQKYSIDVFCLLVNDKYKKHLAIPMIPVGWSVVVGWSVGSRPGWSVGRLGPKKQPTASPNNNDI